MSPPRFRRVLLVLLWAGSLDFAHAADPDPIRGRAVVVGGERGGITACFTCHGLDGAGDASGAFPRLTAQPPFYAYKQLLDYAAGTRANPVMTPIARQLSEQQMGDVAFYYSAVQARHQPPSEAPAELLERGRRIATDGLPEAGVQACNYCHGADGRGMPPSFPYLAGQYAPYAELQLRLWKENVRRNDPLGVMKRISDGLSVEDMRAVSVYYETLRPPGDSPLVPR